MGAEIEAYPRDDEGLTHEITSEATAIMALKKFVAKVGILPQEALFEEGSGLSRGQLVSPAATVALLRYMDGHPWRDAWYASLPVGGVDGTLKDRFVEGPAFHNVRAKTGTLRYVVALSGYVTPPSGEPLVFSILLNNWTGPKIEARNEIDRLIQLLAGQQ